MTNKIEELATQAGLKLEDLPDDVFVPLEKFAELIVRECLSMCKRVKDDCEWRGKEFNIDQMQQQIGVNLCMAEIKKHFGVENDR